MKRYTKADLEQIVYTQLENLNAMGDLLNIMKRQNELLEEANQKMENELLGIKEMAYPATRKRRS